MLVKLILLKRALRIFHTSIIAHCEEIVLLINTYFSSQCLVNFQLPERNSLKTNFSNIREAYPKLENSNEKLTFRR